jgi:hypothetical protein
MKQKFPDLPGWQFETDEVSVSVYEVIGRDSAGRSVSSVGTDLDAVLEQCRKDARCIMMSGRTEGK